MPRMGGYFPFNTTDINHGGGVIVLPPGGIFKPTAGNYLLSLGAQTQLQWFDPILGSWRVIATTDAGLIGVTIDNANYRLINMSGVITGGRITNAGSGATNGIGAAATGMTLTFAGPGVTGGRAALGYPIVGGSVPAPTITTAGSGFLVPPLVICDPPPYGGIQAVFATTLSSGGGIGTITQINGGAGYTAIPKFYIIPQPQFYQGAPSGGVTASALIVPGLVDPTMVPTNTPAPGFQYASQSAASPGALLTGVALTGSGTLTGVVMYDYGALYATIPAVTITGAGAAAVTALPSFCITAMAVNAAGSGYGSGTVPIWESSLGVVQSGIDNSLTGPTAARGTVALSGGALGTPTIESNGFGFQTTPVIAVIPTSLIPSTIGTLTPTMGGVNDTSILQSQVST